MLRLTVTLFPPVVLFLLHLHPVNEWITSRIKIVIYVTYTSQPNLF